MFSKNKLKRRNPKSLIINRVGKNLNIMATFSINGNHGHISYFKFYFRNKTDHDCKYDLSLINKNSYVKKIKGEEKGTIPANNYDHPVIVNFDINFEIKTTLEEGEVPIITVDGTEIKMRFWSGTGSNTKQYINWKDTKDFKVHRDEDNYTSIKNKKFYVWLDAGGHDTSTLNIFISVRDR